MDIFEGIYMYGTIDESGSFCASAIPEDQIDIYLKAGKGFVYRAMLVEVNDAASEEKFRASYNKEFENYVKSLNKGEEK